MQGRGVDRISVCSHSPRTEVPEIDARLLRRALALPLFGLCVGASVQAQAEAYTHIGHAAESFAETPTGQGLLPTAMAEARIAEQHVELAVADSLTLVGMRRHAGHVIHALDPDVVQGVGPGLGFGVRRAALEAMRHVELAAAADSASESVTLHALHITTSLANVVQWVDEAVALAQQIQSTSSVAAAVPLVERLEGLCQAILWGRDGNGDGVVGWREGDGGVAQATYHMNLLRRAEGLRL